MKKIFLGLALTAFIGGMATSSFAQEGEKKSTKTTKTCDKKKKCCKKKCAKKTGTAKKASAPAKKSN